MLKFLLLFTISCFLVAVGEAQTIIGRVVDSASEEALEYVSLGIPGTRMGCISQENGEFQLELNHPSPGLLLRVSMIGYEAQTFPVEELGENRLTIKLVRTPIPLEEVRIKPYTEAGIAGTNSYNRLGGWCGWGGSRFGKGHEIGTLINLGSETVHVNSLFVHVHRQAFDTSYYRLHIRTVEDKLPADELLNDNIILNIAAESGWVELDISDYQIVLNGEIAVSLEWLKVAGVNKDRAMKINKKLSSEYVLFNTKRKLGLTYTRWGVEADWNVHEESSPSIYLSFLR